MPRAVLDANVYISAAIQPASPPGQLIEQFLRGQAFEIILSPAIIDEIIRALKYPKVGRAIRGSIKPDLWFEDIVLLADIVNGDWVLADIGEDPDDVKYIAAALEGRADFLVTGDHGLLGLGNYSGVRIVSPRTFLGLL